MWGTWGQLRTSLICQGWDGSMRPPRFIAGIAHPRPGGVRGCRAGRKNKIHALYMPSAVDLWLEPSRLLSEAPAMPPPIVCPSSFHHVSAHVAGNRQVTGATSKEKPARFFQLTKN